MIELQRIGRWYQFKNDIPFGLERVIDKKLSYVKAGSQFLPNPAWGIQRLYNSKKRAFPAGLLSLVIPILDSYQRQYGETYMIEGLEPIYKLPTQLSDLRDYQREAFYKFWAKQGGLISLPTSAGKTRIAERIIASWPNNNILIVCPTKELCKQWQDELGVMTKFKEIRIATYQKLYREVVKDKEPFKKYALVVWDECHHCSATTLYKIGLVCSDATMLGLTATEKRMDGAEMKIQAILGDIIYKVPIQDLVAKGYIVQGQVHIIDIPKYKARPDEDYRTIYQNAIVNNSERNNIIVNIALNKYMDGTVIIMCKQLKQAKLIYDMLIKNSVYKYRNRIAYVDGLSKDRPKTFEKLIAGDYDIVVCTKIYGEGISIPRLKTMILASGGKSSTEVIQTTGRMLRLFPNKEVAKIYDFRDSGKNLGQHFRERMKIYKENGFEVVEG